VGTRSSDSFAGLRALLVHPIAGARSAADIGGAGESRVRRRDGGALARTHGRRRLRGASRRAVAWQLLRRYGVVFRRLVPARDVTRTLGDTCGLPAPGARGESRGGRFGGWVLGASSTRCGSDWLCCGRPAGSRSRRADRVSGADPLNLVGILTPDQAVPRSRHQPHPLVVRTGAIVVKEGEGRASGSWWMCGRRARHADGARSSGGGPPRWCAPTWVKSKAAARLSRRGQLDPAPRFVQEPLRISASRFRCTGVGRRSRGHGRASSGRGRTTWIGPPARTSTVRPHCREACVSRPLLVFHDTGTSSYILASKP